MASVSASLGVSSHVSPQVTGDSPTLTFKSSRFRRSMSAILGRGLKKLRRMDAGGWGIGMFSLEQPNQDKTTEGDEEQSWYYRE